jgi:predicted peptidase
MRNLVKLWLVLGLAATARQVALGANVADFAEFSLRNSSGAVILPGRLFVPPEASQPAPRPLILFLHGAGESGSNNVAQVNVNIDNLLAEAKRRGAFLYAPQTPNNWSGVGLTDRVMSMVDRALADYSVNANRLYVTGLSNGGGGAWNILSRYPDRFAAGVPICGVNPGSDFAPANLVNQSIAAFHARNDGVVSVSTSRNVINRILAAAGQPSPAYPAAGAPDFVFSAPGLDLNYVEFAFGGHGIWPAVYSAPPLYDWLFAHALPEPSAAVAMAVAGLGLLAARRRRR